MNRFEKIIIFHVFLLPLLAGCTGGGYRQLKDDYHDHSVEKIAAPYIDSAPATTVGTESSPELTIIDSSGEQASLSIVKTLPDDMGAAEKISGRISSSMLVELALTRSPQIKASESRWKATLFKYSQAERLENIMAQYKAFTHEAGISRKSVMKDFPHPGSLAMKKAIAKKEADISQQKYYASIRDITARMELDYAELLYLYETKVLEQENLTILRELETVASTNYGTGDSGFNYVIQLQMEISKLDNDIKTIQQQKDTVTASINRLLALPPETTLGRPVEFKDGNSVYIKLPGNDFAAAELTELYDTAIKDNQEIKIARLKIEKAQLAIELGEKMTYPDFTLGLFESTKSRQGRKTPFWFGKNDAYLSEARKRLSAMKDELIKKEDDLRYEIKRIYLQLDRRKREKTLYEDTLLKQAVRSFDAARLGYQAGKSDFLSLLNAHILLLKTDMEYTKVKMNLEKNMARMKKLLGGILK